MQCTKVRLDLRVYALDTIKKAGYRLGGRYRVSIEIEDEHHVAVTLTSKDLLAGDVGVTVDFEREVLDQGLREQIAKETEAVRNLLIAQAFSRISLLDPEGEEGDVDADPLQIGQPDRIVKHEDAE